MAQNPFDQFDGATGANPFDAFDQPAPAAERPERTVLGTLGDIGVTALKGAVGLPQAFVGIADLVSGGQAGKDFEDAGLRFKDAQKILDGAYSPAQQAANREVQAAEGFVGTAKAAVQNPSVIATTVGESLPQMLGGAAIARGGLALSSKVAPWAAGAIGEGVMGAGSAAEQIRSESADGLLTGKQTAAAIASGIGTAAIGGAAGKFAGSKVGQRLGLSDVDTMLATGKFNKTPAGFIKQVVGSGVSEGVFEELPQSMQEQMWQNYAQDKPILEGVGKAGALGMLAGASMGGAAGGFNAAQASITKGPDDQPAPPALAPAPAAGGATGAAAQAPSAPGSGSKPAGPQVATADATQAETALRTPVALTALDRVNEIDSKSANIRERLSEISPENGYGPAFDQERQDMAAQAAMLEQERASIASTWPAAVKGAPTSFSTESGARLDGEYALMDAADLVTSHDEGLRPNPLFPQELQPRDRSRNASELQVSGIVQKLDPARLGLSADAATGAPIVGADGLVESGNARTIAMKRVYQANGQKAEDYKAWLRANAPQFGLTPEAVDGMPKPVLVRVRGTPVNRAEFARQANASTVQRMSPSEQAVSDARRLASLDGLNPDEDGNFTSSHDFIRQFMATLPITEQSDLIESDGRLSTAGYRRVQNAVLAKAYGDSPSLRRMTESLDNNLVNVSKALLRVAPTIAAARERMEVGTLHAADIAPDLLAAVEGLSALKEKGWTVVQELAQTDLSGPRYTPEAADLLAFLAGNVRSPRRIAEFVQRYYETLEQAGDPSQPSMFGDDGPAPARADLLKQAQGTTNVAGTKDDAKSPGQDAQRGVHREGAQAHEQGGRESKDAPGSRRGDQGDGAAPTDAGRGQQGKRAREAANDGTSEWVAFPADSGTLGIPRRDMPQIKAQHRGALMNFLEARGIEGEKAEVSADSLKPTQAEFSRVKVERFMETGPMGERSVLVSSDGYVLDGHHQWMAAKSMGVPVPVIRLGSPIRELLANVYAFPSVQQSEGAELDPRALVVQEFKDAMADLAQIASRYTRAAMVPEKTPDLMPTLVKLFEAAIRLVGTDAKHATAWVKAQIKQDPRFKTFWNKIGPELYQKAAMEAVKKPSRSAQAALFDDPKEAANAVQAGPADDLAAVVTPIVKTAKINGRDYDMGRDNFKPPAMASFIAGDVLVRADGYVQQFYSQAATYAMPDEARAEAERLLAPFLKRAGDAKATFDQKVIGIAESVGALGQILAPIKGANRAAEKMHQDATEEGREMRATDVKDLLRSTIVVESYDAMEPVLDAIRNGFEVVREKNKRTPQARAQQGGYADFTMFVKMPNGVLAEIQINTPEMLAAKGDHGHKLFEVARDLPSGSDKQPEILAAMSEIYAAAFDAAAARFASNSREWAAQDKNAASEAGAPVRGPLASMPGKAINDAPSSDALNQRPSGNLTNSSPENPKTNSQPSGNLSGTRMETPFTDIVDRTASDGEKDDASRLSFAGARAATADTHALVRAQDRLAAGEDAETVRRETGWHRGADGRMRFEISDREAKVDMALLANLHRGGFDGRAIEHVSYRRDEDGTYWLTLAPKDPKAVSDFISVSGIPAKLLPSLLPQSALDAIERNQGDEDFIGADLGDARRVHAPFEFMGFNALPLEVVMDHPKLFAAYPALREITVQVDRKLGNGARFAMTEYVDGSAGRGIKIGNPLAKDVDSVLLHEIQHGIQDIEGFATGGSPTQFAGVDLVSQLELDRINAKLNSGDYDMSEYDSLLQKKRDILNTAGTESSHGLYRRLAGEVEARNTQARKNITDLGRKLIAPSKTADVSDADVIVTFNDKEMHSAPTPSNAMPSRGTPAPGGMPVADLRELADRLRAAMPNMPTVNVLADPSEAPYKLREYINRQDAWDDVEGAMHNGELYLFASGLQDAARAEHVLAEHEAGHFGLRAVLGPQGLRAAMRMVWLENASVRKAATQLQKRGKLSDIAATEEVIVDLPSAQLVALKGWRKVVLKARDYLAARGYSALSQRLTDWLDGSLSQQQRADLFVADLVRAARDYVRGTRAGSPHGYLGVTRLSSSLADDLTRQEQWLNSEARARGFKDIDDLVDRNYPVFEKLAALWREKNPADEGVMLSRAALADSAKTAAERADELIQATVLKGAPLDAIARGLTRATGLERLTGAIYDRAALLLDRYTPERIKAGVVSDFGVPEAVIDQRTMLQGRQRVQLRKAGALIEKLATLTRAESRVAYEWMNMDGADPQAYVSMMQGLPEESVKVLQEVQKMIDKLSQDAVRLGQLDPEAYQRNRFAYLRRSYAKHTLEQTAGEKAKRARTIAVLGEQYKGRGLTESAPMDRIKAAAPEWWGRKLAQGKADAGLKGEAFIRLERRAPSGERTKPLDGMEGKQIGRLLEVAYWPAGERVPSAYADWTPAGTWEVRDVKGPNLVFWRDFTKTEREQMGEIDEARFAIAKTLHAMIHDVEVGRYLEWLAATQAKKEGDTIPGVVVEASERMRDTFAPGEWVRVPDTKIQGTAVLKYGKLAGRYLPGPVWNDLRQVVAGGRFQPFGETYAKVLSLWKTSKTALSPAVHMNNVMSNFVMADWHDVRAAHVSKALRILLAASQKRGGIADREAAVEVLNRYKDSGGDAGSWVTQEISRDQIQPLLESLEQELAASAEGGTAEAQTGVYAALQHAMHLRFPQAWDAAVGSRAGKAVTAAGGALLDIYQAEDDVFRLAAWLAAKEDGANDLEAGKRARKSFLDYSINAPWINAMRASAWPFLSFTYRAVPMLLETAARKPHKLMKLMAIAGGLNALGTMMAGGGGDDERKMLPEEKAGSIWGMVPKLIRMPWNDQHGSPVYLDIRRWVPVGDVLDIGQGHAAVPILPGLMPGGPLVLMGEVVLNRSAFTGKPITLETDTPTQQATKLGDYLYKAFAPNLLGLPNTYATEGVAGSLTGRTDAFGRELSTAQAMASSFGVKLGSYPADVMRRNLTAAALAQSSEIEKNIAQLKRQRQTGRIDDAEFQDLVAVEQEKKVKLMRKLAEKTQ